MFGLFLVISIGIVDFGTGLELRLMGFYLFPIALVSWFVNRRAGISIAALCALAWLMANHLGGRRYSSDLITVWNFAMRTAVLMMVAYALSHLKAMLDQVSELASRIFLLDCPMAALFQSRRASNGARIQFRAHDFRVH